MYRLNATSDTSSLRGKVIRRRSSDMVSSLGASSTSGSGSGSSNGGGAAQSSLSSRRRNENGGRNVGGGGSMQSGPSLGSSYDSQRARRRGRIGESSSPPASSMKRPSSVSSQGYPRSSSSSGKLAAREGIVQRAGSADLFKSRKETESTSSMSSFLAMDCQDENDNSDVDDRLMDSGLFTRPTDNRGSNRTPATLSIWESTRPRKDKTSRSIHTAATKRTEGSDENIISSSDLRRRGGASASNGSIGKSTLSPAKGREQLAEKNVRAGSSSASNSRERKDPPVQTEGNCDFPPGGPGGIVITVPEGEEMKDSELDPPDFGGHGPIIFATKRPEDDDEISQLSTSIFGSSADQCGVNSGVPSEAAGPSNFRMSAHPSAIGTSSYNENNPVVRPQHMFSANISQPHMAGTPAMATNMSQWPRTHGLPAYGAPTQVLPSYGMQPNVSTAGVWGGQQAIPHQYQEQLAQPHHGHPLPYPPPHHHQAEEQDFEPLLLPTRAEPPPPASRRHFPPSPSQPFGSTIPDSFDVASSTRRAKKWGATNPSAQRLPEMQASTRRHSMELRQSQPYPGGSARSVSSASSFHGETIPQRSMDLSVDPSSHHSFPLSSAHLDPYNDSLYRPSGRMTGRPPSSPLMSLALRLRLVLLSLLNDFGMRGRNRQQKMYDSEDESTSVPTSGVCGSFGSRGVPDMDYHRMTMGMSKSTTSQGSEVLFRLLWKLLFGLCVITVCLLGLQTALGDGIHHHHHSVDPAAHSHNLKRSVADPPRVPSVSHHIESPMDMQYQPQSGGAGTVGGMTRNGWAAQKNNMVDGNTGGAMERPPPEVVKASTMRGFVDSTEAATRTEQNKETVVVLPETLENLVDIWDLPADRLSDVPFFWHIPRSAGATMNSILSEVYHLTLASDAGGRDARAQDEELQVVKFAPNNHYVNVDTSTEEGLQRAKDLNLIPSGLANAVVSTLLHQSATLFTPDNRGRMFALVRHPVERAVSLFYHLKDSVGTANNVDMTDLSIEEYYQRGLGERNWMTRFLADQPIKTLDEVDLAIAKEVLRRKCLVGLMESLDDSLARFERYFGWSMKSESDRDKLENLLHWTWPMRHKHSIVIENSATWALIVRYNEFDLQLYHYAKTLFQEQAMIFARDMP